MSASREAAINRLDADALGSSEASRSGSILSGIGFAIIYLADSVQEVAKALAKGGKKEKE